MNLLIRLSTLAARHGISLNKLFEELSTHAIAEFDMENGFRLLAAKGRRERGLELLDRLDTHFETASGSLHEDGKPFGKV